MVSSKSLAHAREVCRRPLDHIPGVAMAFQMVIQFDPTLHRAWTIRRDCLLRNDRNDIESLIISISVQKRIDKKVHIFSSRREC